MIGDAQTTLLFVGTNSLAVDGDGEGDGDGQGEVRSDNGEKEYEDWRARRAGVGLIGAGSARGPELEKYLRTKVERMGHGAYILFPPSASPCAVALIWPLQSLIFHHLPLDDLINYHTVLEHH